jgi:hypothetical protein
MATSNRDKLTKQQRLFVRYMREIGDATEAARKAGYAEASASQRAYKLMRHPIIKLELAKTDEQLLSELTSEVNRMKNVDEVDARWIKRELLSCYQKCVGAVRPATSSKTGKALKDEDGKVIYRYEATNAIRILELLGKMEGVFKEAKVDLAERDRDLIGRLNAGKSRG